MSETRFCEVTERRSASRGRSTITMRCPFCGVSVQARLWSLAGGGKRCECGAMMHGRSMNSDDTVTGAVGYPWGLDTLSRSTVTEGWLFEPVRRHPASDWETFEQDQARYPRTDTTGEVNAR